MKNEELKMEKTGFLKYLAGKSLNPSYKAIIQAFTEYLQTLGFSSSMCYNYPFFVTQFLEYAEEKNLYQINQITEKVVNEYFTYLENRTGKRTKRPLGISTLNGIFKAIDQFLSFLQQMGMQNAPVPPNRHIRTDKQEEIGKIKPFTQEEIKILYNSISNTYLQFPFEQRQAKRYELRLCRWRRYSFDTK
jgi:integrase/recombinase XerD